MRIISAFHILYPSKVAYYRHFGVVFDGSQHRPYYYYFCIPIIPHNALHIMKFPAKFKQHRYPSENPLTSDLYDQLLMINHHISLYSSWQCGLRMALHSGVIRGDRRLQRLFFFFLMSLSLHTWQENRKKLNEVLEWVHLLSIRIIKCRFTMNLQSYWVLSF